jgi:hypothetical protein
MAVRPSLHPKHRPIAYLSRTQYKTRTSRTYLETDALETTALIHAVRLYLNCSHRIYRDFTHSSACSAVITPQTPPDRLPKPHSIQNTNFPHCLETDALETTALIHAVRLYLNCSHRIYRDFTHSYGRSAVITPQTPPDRLPKPHSIQNTNFPHLPETDALETTALIHAVRLYLNCSHRIYRDFTHSSACSAVITPQTPPDRLPKPHSIQNTNFPPCLETDALETTALIHAVRLYLNCSHRIYRDFTHSYGRSAVITPQTPPDRLPKPHSIQNTNFPHCLETDALETTALIHAVRLYLNCSHRIYRDFTHSYGRSAVITPQTPPDRLPKPHSIQNTNFPHCLETDALETTALIHAVRLYLNCSHRIYRDFTHSYGRSAVITPQTPPDRLPKPHSIQNTNFPHLPGNGRS